MGKRKERKTVEEVIESAERLAFYNRVSTKEQRKEGKEYGQQYAKVKDFLKKYDKKVENEDVFSDTMSAYSKPFTSRSDLEKLLHAAEKKEIDAIIVSDRDRLSRQTEEHFQLRSLLERIGIPVVIASRGELYESDDFIRTLVEDALTRLESDNISTRTKATLKSMLEKNRYIGGKPPYGFSPTKEDEKVVRFSPIHEEVRDVVDIFNLYKKSETFSSIAKNLNKHLPKKWSASRVKEIITNPIYTGYHVYNRYEKGTKLFNPIELWKWFRSPFICDEDILITQEDWWYCWHKYTKTKDKQPRYLNTSFYLKDLLFCHCGEKMKGIDKRTNIKKPGTVYGKRYYICQNCKEKIDADKLNNLVLDEIFNMPAPKHIVMYEVNKLIEKEIAIKHKRISELDEEIIKENNNLNILKMFKKMGDKKDGLLQESKQHELLAYLLSKGDSEINLKKSEKEIQHVKSEYQKLIEMTSDDRHVQEWVDSFFQYRKWSSLSDPEIRNLTLFLVENCTMIDSIKIGIKIKSLPPKEYSMS